MFLCYSAKRTIHLKQGKNGLDKLWAKCLQQLEQQFDFLLKQEPPIKTDDPAEFMHWLDSITEKAINQAINTWEGMVNQFYQHAKSQNLLLTITENNEFQFTELTAQTPIDESVTTHISKEDLVAEYTDKETYFSPVQSQRAYTVPVHATFSEGRYKQFVQVLNSDYTSASSDLQTHLQTLQLDTLTLEQQKILSKEFKDHASMGLKKIYFQLFVDNFRSCTEQYVRTEGTVEAKEKLHAATTLLNSVVAANIANKQQIDTLKQNQWKDTLKLTNDLLNQYVSGWFKFISWDRKANLLNLKTQLSDLKSGDWEQLNKIIHTAKKDVWEADLQHDRYWFWLRMRNTKGSRYLRTLEQIADVVQESTQMLNTSAQTNYQDLCASLKASLDSLSARGKWHNKSVQDVPNSAISTELSYVNYLKLIQLKNQLNDYLQGPKIKHDLSLMANQSLKICTQLMHEIELLDQETHCKIAIEKAMQEALPYVQRYAHFKPKVKAAKELAEFEFSIQKALNNQDIKIQRRGSGSDEFTVTIDESSFDFIIKDGAMFWKEEGAAQRIHP